MTGHEVAPEGAGAGAQAARQEPRRKAALIIGADTETRAVLHLGLEQAGFTVAEAGSGAEGITRHRIMPVDLLVLHLPGSDSDGLDAVLDLGSDHPDLEIIVISDDHGAPSDAEKKLGARRMLKKPFGVEQLLQAIDGVVGMREAVRELRRHPRYSTRVPVAFVGDQGEGRGSIVNLSLEGCAVDSDSALAPGTLLLLHLTVPNVASPLTVDVAAVRWTQGQRFGAQFLWMDPPAQETLKKFLFELASPA